MSSSLMAILNRTKYLNRWQLMRNARTESLIEHSADTAFIAFVLANIHNEIEPEHNVDVYKVATLALFHDCTEVLTGDFPTPVKYFSESFHEHIEELEELAMERLINSAPSQVKPAMRTVLTLSKDSMEGKLIKAADRISAVVKCIMERQSGNQEFIQAEKKLWSLLDHSELKVVHVFMEEFMQAYEDTLDLNLA